MSAEERRDPARPPRLTRARVADGLLAAVVLAAGIAIGLHHGRVGYMPLDQSIVFDAGWRMLGGQVPLRDFATPAGITPGAMQAAAFGVFGVSWLVYVAHAAVVNGLFGVTVLALLRALGAPPGLAAMYGLLSTVVFYPPFGVPYLEQHAFFFGLVAVLAAALALRGSPGWSASVPLWIVLGLLSKPIPTVFLAPLPFVMLAGSRERRRHLSAAGIGALAVVVAVLALGAGLGVDATLAADSLWRLPAGEGAARTARALTELPSLSADVLVRWSVLGLVALPVAMAMGARRSVARWPLVVATWLFVASLAFALLTNNQAENAAGCLFAVVGLAHVVLLDGLGVRLARAATGVLLLVAVSDAVRFDRRVNAPRLVHSLQDEPTIDARTELPAALGFLRWRLHFFYRYGPGELGRLVAWLREQTGNFFYLGDSSIVYGLAGKPSTSPVLWFHRRLTTPPRGTPAFDAFERRFLASLREHEVRYVVLEGRETYDGVRPSRLPALAALVDAGRVVQRIGPFTVVEITPP